VFSCFFFFFFSSRRRHTRWTGDWSSDVCSSDLTDASIPLLCIWQIVLGIGNAFIWAPTAATATRNLPMHLAGAGAGVYNATRQVGSVIGSAAIAVLIDSRIAHYLPGHGSQAVTG